MPSLAKPITTLLVAGNGVVGRASVESPNGDVVAVALSTEPTVTIVEVCTDAGTGPCAAIHTTGSGKDPAGDTDAGADTGPGMAVACAPVADTTSVSGGVICTSPAPVVGTVTVAACAAAGAPVVDMAFDTAPASPLAAASSPETSGVAAGELPDSGPG